MRQRLGAPLRPLIDFLQTEVAGGVALLVATVAALVWANSPLGPTYETVWHAPIAIGPLELDARHWVNEALMAVFFFVVGLEIKRELVDGELRTKRRAALPAAAAFGGMVVPALIFLAFNRGGPGERGWGVPMATDIAFAVGVLALFGRRVPVGMKVFLLSLAIVDDIGAIVVIALFYTAQLDALALVIAAVGIAAYAVSWRGRGRAIAPLRVAIAAITWLAMYSSGVHATIAGVALGLATPAGRVPDPSPAESLEHHLHPWTSYVVVPLFAVANAGVSVAPDRLLAALGSPVGLGIVFGLIAGKLAGITGATYLACRLGIGELPERVGMRHIGAAAAVAGIGFTVSLFIVDLAFMDPGLVADAKVAVLVASTVAALAGSVLVGATLRGDRRSRSRTA